MDAIGAVCPQFSLFGTDIDLIPYATSRCLTVGAVIAIPGCDRSGIKVLLVVFVIVCLGQSSA